MSAIFSRPHLVNFWESEMGVATGDMRWDIWCKPTVVLCFEKMPWGDLVTITSPPHKIKNLLRFYSCWTEKRRLYIHFIRQIGYKLNYKVWPRLSAWKAMETYYEEISVIGKCNWWIDQSRTWACYLQFLNARGVELIQLWDFSSQFGLVSFLPLLLIAMDPWKQ